MCLVYSKARIGEKYKGRSNSTGRNNDCRSFDTAYCSITSIFLDTFGYLHIVGEVLNTSNSTARSIQLTASIYDPSHTIIGTASGYADIDVLARTSICFCASNDLSKVASIGSYTLYTSSEPAFGQEKPAFLRLTIGRAYTDSTGFSSPFGTYHIIGEVTNQANSTANFIKVSGAFSNYDQVIGEGTAYTTPSSLAPGQTTPFDMLVQSRPGQPIVYAYYNVQSQEYSMINEQMPNTQSQPSSTMQLKQPTANSTTITQSTTTTAREEGVMQSLQQIPSTPDSFKNNNNKTIQFLLQSIHFQEELPCQWQDR